MRKPSIKTRVFTTTTPALPMNYPGFVFRTLQADGYDAVRLFANTDLSTERIADPYFRTEYATLQRFYLNAIELTGDPHLGPRLARRFQPNYVGLPAYAAMNAARFEDALATLGRFFSLTFPAIEFTYAEGDEYAAEHEASIRLRAKLPIERIAYFAWGSALISCDEILRAVLRRSSVATRAETTIEEPEGWSRVAPEITRVPVRFDAADNRIFFPAKLLRERLPGADPINHKRFVALCEKFAVDVGYETTPLNQVLSFIEADGNIGAPFAKAAAALGYSERGLRRSLESAGTSYRLLTDQVRENRARTMLANTSRPINEIAHALGFETPSNFSRSFKRWTGVTPGAFREARKAPDKGGRN
ncbi:MAG: AraC family transcriptional regulator ligand-binding domain-containing protein [Pseudomonadota bacterium]